MADVVRIAQGNELASPILPIARENRLNPGQPLAPAQWLPKPASRWFPENGLSLRDQRSPSEGAEGGRQTASGWAVVLLIVICSGYISRFLAVAGLRAPNLGQTRHVPLDEAGAGGFAD